MSLDRVTISQIREMFPDHDKRVLYVWGLLEKRLDSDVKYSDSRIKAAYARGLSKYMKDVMKDD